MTDNETRMSCDIHDEVAEVLRSIKFSSQRCCYSLHHKAISLDCRKMLLVPNRVVDFDDRVVH